MRWGLRAGAGLAALALAACGQEAAAPPTAAPPPPAPEPAPPPGPPPPAYFGLWAARAELCPAQAWMFDVDKLATAGEVACAFQSVSEIAGGFSVTATCTAEGEARPYQFTLKLAGEGAAQRMTVSRGPWDGPVTLVRCDG